MTIRLQIFEIIAIPAHAWLWVCAKLVGLEFRCGPVSNKDEELN